MSKNPRIDEPTVEKPLPVGKAAARYKPTPRECALLLLLLLTQKESVRTRVLTRARLSQITLQRLWCRHSIDVQFLAAVNEWLLDGGWAVLFAGETFGAVKIETVMKWPSATSKRIANELADVATGRFDFPAIEFLLDPNDDTDDEDEASDQES